MCSRKSRSIGLVSFTCLQFAKNLSFDLDSLNSACERHSYAGKKRKRQEQAHNRKWDKCRSLRSFLFETLGVVCGLVHFGLGVWDFSQGSSFCTTIGNTQWAVKTFKMLTVAIVTRKSRHETAANRSGKYRTWTSRAILRVAPLSQKCMASACRKHPYIVI